MTASGETSLGILRKLRWLMRTRPVTHVLIGLDFDFQFMIDAIAPTDFLRQEHPLVSGESYLSFFSRYLSVKRSDLRKVARAKRYLSFPILDGYVPKPRDLLDLVRRIDDTSGTTYIHCAEGYGRTGMVAAAILLARGLAQDVDEAVRQVRRKRPGVRLRRAQRRTVAQVAQALGATEPTHQPSRKHHAPRRRPATRRPAPRATAGRHARCSRRPGGRARCVCGRSWRGAAAGRPVGANRRRAPAGRRGWRRDPAPTGKSRLSQGTVCLYRPGCG